MTLTGLGTETFDQAIENVMFIHTMFDRALKDGAIEGWQPDTFRTYHAFNTSNRYFSSRRLNGCATPVAFPDMVDPNGILASLAGNDLIHCEENQVHYYEITELNENGNLRSAFTYSVKSTI